MFDEPQRHVADTIGGILLAVTPADAAKIIARGDLGAESAGVRIQWRTTEGDTRHFSFDEQPFEEIIQLSDAFMSLRELMVADGHDSWNGIAFTVERDGRFAVDLFYDRA